MTEEIGFYGSASSKASTNSIVPIVALFNNAREPSSPPGLSLIYSVPLSVLSLCGGASKLDLVHLPFHYYPILIYFHYEYLIYVY